jgi:hypothetical protein
MTMRTIKQLAAGTFLGVCTLGGSLGLAGLVGTHYGMPWAWATLAAGFVASIAVGVVAALE